jgi:hypothetical protein
MTERMNSDLLPQFKTRVSEGMTPERAVMTICKDYLIEPAIKLLAEFDENLKWEELPEQTDRGVPNTTFKLVRHRAIPTASPKKGLLARIFGTEPTMVHHINTCEFRMFTTRPESKAGFKLKSIDAGEAVPAADKNVANMPITAEMVDQFSEQGAREWGGKLFNDSFMVFTINPLAKTFRQLYPELPRDTFNHFMNIVVMPVIINGERLNPKAKPAFTPLFANLSVAENAPQNPTV